jgi:hypothetical protein
LAVVRRSRKAWEGVGYGQEVKEGEGICWQWSGGPGRRWKALAAVRSPGRHGKALAAVRRSRNVYKGVGSGQEVQEGA